MGLESYNEIRKKIINQMHEQAKDVKIATIEQWAKENGYGEIYFTSYENAQNWVENEVNTDSKKAKSFNKFENEADMNLESLMGDLERGASSPVKKKIETLAKKYVSPTLKLLLTALTVNLIATKAVEMGMVSAGKNIHEWVDGLTKGISKIPGANNIVQKIISNMEITYNDKIIPITKNVFFTALSALEGYGLIKTSRFRRYRGKIDRMKDKTKEQEEEISDLKKELAELQKDEKEETNNETTKQNPNRLKNINKTQQMRRIVSGLKELFGESVDIPDIPEGCYNIEEYGEFLRNFLKIQNIPKEECDKIYLSLDIFKNNIGKVNRELKLAKEGKFAKAKRFYGDLKKEPVNKISDTSVRVHYSIKTFVKYALRNGLTQKDLEDARNNENIKNNLIPNINHEEI